MIFPLRKFCIIKKKYLLFKYGVRYQKIVLCVAIFVKTLNDGSGVLSLRDSFCRKSYKRVEILKLVISILLFASQLWSIAIMRVIFLPASANGYYASSKCVSGYTAGPVLACSFVKPNL